MNAKTSDKNMFTNKLVKVSSLDKSKVTVSRIVAKHEAKHEVKQFSSPELSGLQTDTTSHQNSKLSATLNETHCVLGSLNHDTIAITDAKMCTVLKEDGTVEEVGPSRPVFKDTADGTVEEVGPSRLVFKDTAASNSCIAETVAHTGDFCSKITQTSSTDLDYMGNNIEGENMKGNTSYIEKGAYDSRKLQDLHDVKGIETNYKDVVDIVKKRVKYKRIKRVTCPKCGKVYSSNGSLAKHLQVHSGNKPFQCEICGKAFCMKYYLDCHKLSHGGQRNYKCEQCGKCFLRKPALNVHRRSHSDIKAFECKECGKKFKSKGGLKLHMVEHGEGKKVICHLCGKSFNHASYLTSHLASHSDEKPYKCDQCGKAFPYSQSLVEHIRRHNDVKPAVCETCGKSFNNKRALKAHMLYHDNVSQFACKECKMYFKSLPSLNKHLYKTHKREYICEFCEKTFHNKKYLHVHLANFHKEERKTAPDKLAKTKKAECSLCHQSFYNRYVLRTHLANKHGLSDEEIKSILEIRKRAQNKNGEIPRNNFIPNVNKKNDLSRSLIDNNTFRVYYRDDEMAVYVKGNDSVNKKYVDISKHPYIENDMVDNTNVKYVFVEGTNENNNNDSNVHDSVVDVEMDQERLIIQAKNNQDSNRTVSLLPEQIQVKSSSESDNVDNQNYYVVFTDSETNVGSIEEVQELQGETIYQTVDENGTEQIVVILNDNKEESTLLENGQIYEIMNEDSGNSVVETGDNFEAEGIESSSTYLFDGREMSGNVNSAINNDTRQTGISKDIDKTKLQSGTGFTRSQDPTYYHTIQDKVPDIVLTMQGLESSVPLLDQLDNVLDELASEEKVTHEKDTNGDNEFIDETRKNIPRVVDEDSYADDYHSAAMETDDENLGTKVEILVPKTISAVDFAGFENALKSKSEEFQSPAEFKAFLDKMIQSLENVKQSVLK